MYSAVLKVSTADQFYSAMAHLSVQLLDEKIIVADNLIQVRLSFSFFKIRRIWKSVNHVDGQ